MTSDIREGSDGTVNVKGELEENMAVDMNDYETERYVSNDINDLDTRLTKVKVHIIGNDFVALRKWLRFSFPDPVIVLKLLIGLRYQETAEE